MTIFKMPVKTWTASTEKNAEAVSAFARSTAHQNRQSLKGSVERVSFRDF